MPGVSGWAYFIVVDNNLVWTRQVDPKEREMAHWIKAAHIREVTLISGGPNRGRQGDGVGSWKPEVTARVRTA